MPSNTPYRGSTRKLVLAFDVGTTYSGISYSVLDPGQVPVIKGVTRFPAHEHISGASKIPTIIYYDPVGKVRAVGAEAMRDGIVEAAEDGKWIKAEWFKLHLRSKIGEGKTITDHIPPLPLNKTVIQVFADFLRYLLQCASTYIQDTHANGPDLWNSFEDDIEFVLSHPNGWEGKEQSQMRDAALLAGLVPDTPRGRARISFVTEGEASLHFAVQNGVLSAAMKKGEGVVIVDSDAGGGTIDVSTYRTQDAANTYEEIAAPQCHFHGSVFVNVLARVFLLEYLAESPFLDDLDHIVHCFDKTTKPRFRDAGEPQYVKFGSTRDNDANINIRFGQLKLEGLDVAQFFQPSIDCIVKAVLNQKKTSLHSLSHVVFVGGFAASDWLFDSVQRSLSKSGLNVLRPENHVNKAVSDGAISFHLDHFVRTRVSKVTYGVVYAAHYQEHNAEHTKRLATAISLPSGLSAIPGAFGVLVPKNTQISETKEFRYRLAQTFTNKVNFKSTTVSIWCYRGDNLNPSWKDEDVGSLNVLPNSVRCNFHFPLTENYTKLATVIVDFTHLPLEPLVNKTGEAYYRVDYEVVLLFGLTEMQAQLAWQEKVRCS
ncbi:hypothetical protein BDZ97DRAFT_2022504 [Flammula alnicola]|nr:hypothetical protein BDZ97DRAFT_2022504 [Flammula alnicola]